MSPGPVNLSRRSDGDKLKSGMEWFLTPTNPGQIDLWPLWSLPFVTWRGNQSWVAYFNMIGSSSTVWCSAMESVRRVSYSDWTVVLPAPGAEEGR